jgi:hypothetical protein
MDGSAEHRRVILHGFVSNAGVSGRAGPRRRRTPVESMQHWLYKNGRWAVVVLGLSLAGTMLAVTVSSFGQVVSIIVWGAIPR